MMIKHDKVWTFPKFPNFPQQHRAPGYSPGRPPVATRSPPGIPRRLAPTAAGIAARTWTNQWKNQWCLNKRDTNGLFFSLLYCLGTSQNVKSYSMYLNVSHFLYLLISIRRYMMYIFMVYIHDDDLGCIPWASGPIANSCWGYRVSVLLSHQKGTTYRESRDGILLG